MVVNELLLLSLLFYICGVKDKNGLGPTLVTYQEVMLRVVEHHVDRFLLQENLFQTSNILMIYFPVKLQSN